jgi:hypothetical protein
VSREPHLEQKPRLCLPPAVLGVKWYRSWPFVTRNADEGTTNPGTNPPPVTRWQSRQWHLNIIMGSAEHS